MSGRASGQDAPPAPHRFERIAAALAFGWFAVFLAVGLRLPVYTDEVGWRFQERAWHDGVDIMFNDLCGPNTLARPPWFMWPARWWSAMANGALASPGFVRAEGVACAVVLAVLLWMLVGRVAGEDALRQRLRMLLFGLLGLGVLPLLMVLSRPEQPVLLAVAGALAVAFGKDRREGAWVRVGLIVLLGVVAASYHLKGVLYAPVFVAALLVCAKGTETRVPRAAGIAALAAIMAQAAVYWTGRFRCPGDAAFAAQLTRENIAAVLAGDGNPLEKLGQLVSGANPFTYLPLAMPSNAPMSNWVPAGAFPPGTVAFAVIAINLLWIPAVLVAAASIVLFLARRRWRALAEPRVIVALSVLACIALWGASQLNRNVYEASHVLPMLAVFAVLGLSLPGAPTGARAFGWLSAGAAGAALASGAMVLGALWGPLRDAAKEPGYLPGQPFSISVGPYAPVRNDIRRAMAGAGFVPGQPLTRLLVDDVTYLSLQDTRLPLHRLGVLEVWTGSITDPVSYLRNRRSDGVVVGCDYLPERMRRVAARSGKVCAIARATLDRL